MTILLIKAIVKRSYKEEVRFLAILETVWLISFLQPIKPHGNHPLLTLGRPLKEAGYPYQNQIEINPWRRIFCGESNLDKTHTFICLTIYLLNKDLGVSISGSSLTNNNIVNYMLKLRGDGRIHYWFIKNAILTW